MRNKQKSPVPYAVRFDFSASQDTRPVFVVINEHTPGCSNPSWAALHSHGSGTTSFPTTCRSVPSEYGQLQDELRVLVLEDFVINTVAVA